MDSKPLWQSKTVIFNALVGLIGVVASLGYAPQLQVWIQANSGLVLGGLSLVGLALRLISKDKIQIWS